jgi:hypothetical protein
MNSSPGCGVDPTIWTRYAQCELNGVDHRLALSRGALEGITPTRSIAAGLDLTEHAKAVRQLAHSHRTRTETTASWNRRYGAARS